MKICSKCKLEKPDDQYYTYWHSRQEKYRTRRICQNCIKEQQKQIKSRLTKDKPKLIEEPIHEEIIQPDPPELIGEEYKDNTEYKYCKGCNTYKIIEGNFYTWGKLNRPQTLCKVCHNKKSRQRTKEYFEHKRINNGGSERVKNRPNVYMDEYQKEQTFWIMNLMGWTFDEETGVWWKEGIKDKFKQWDKIKNRVKVKPEKQKRKIIDMDKIVELKNRGFSNTQISDMLDYTQVTIRKYLKLYKLENNNNI